MSKARKRIEVEVCPKTNRRFKRRPCGRRRFLCPHDRRTDSCNIGVCAKSRFIPIENRLCPCNSGLTARGCRCGLPGSGKAYCNLTGKAKTRCRCGGDLCGSSFCKEHGRRMCKFCNPIDHLVGLVRSRVNVSLKSKNVSTIDVLGIDTNGYRAYLEKSFQPGMTWSNQATEWEIGHRIPLYYQTPDISQVKERLHYTNTFAQWKHDNSKQGYRSVWTLY